MFVCATSGLIPLHYHPTVTVRIVFLQMKASKRVDEKDGHVIIYVEQVGEP